MISTWDSTTSPVLIAILIGFFLLAVFLIAYVQGGKRGPRP